MGRWKSNVVERYIRLYALCDLMLNSSFPLLYRYLDNRWLFNQVAEDRAIFRNNYNLGLHDRKVLWFGNKGMHWHELLPKLQHKILFHPRPSMILIHVGGNDLVQVKQVKLMKRIKKDLKYIAAVFPSIFVVWSDVLPRKQWRDLRILLKIWSKCITKGSVLIVLDDRLLFSCHWAGLSSIMTLIQQLR